MMRSTSDPESTKYEELPSSCRYYPFTRQQEVSWHPEAVATHLASLCEMHPGDTHLLQTGWSERQVAPLRQRYGVNLVAGDANSSSSGSEHSGTSPLSRLLHSYLAWVRPVSEALLGQLKEPLILMLLGSAGISVALGNVADAASIAVALLIVSAVAAVQEYRSELALEQLQNMVPHTCTVLRDGVVRDDCLARDLVVGDLVLLQTGDRVPADCRVVDAVELALDESALTGETHAQHKTGQGLLTTAASTARAPALTEQQNMVFAGTLVLDGRGRAVVVAVGGRTEFGKVASELNDISSRKSPLQLKIDELSQRLAFFSTAAIALIAIIGWLLGRPFLETLTVAVSLAVAAIPEGLPICVTVTLALGVLRMARRNAIVKKLPVVESLGCATAVASDKTGTLTQNESA